MHNLIEEIDIAGILESADSRIQILNAFDRMEFKLFQIRIQDHQLDAAITNAMAAIKKLKGFLALEEFRGLIKSPDWTAH